MQRITSSSGAPSQGSLWVIGIAILLACVEVSWKRNPAVETDHAVTRHVNIRTDADRSDYVVYRTVDDRAGTFSLRPGDDCAYVDAAESISRDNATGKVLVPIFCKTRGSGWASLNLLAQTQ